MDDNESLGQVTNDPFAAVKVPEYKILMLARFFFIMGLRMMATLVGWWIYELTNDPFAIGLIGLSEVIPALSMALYSGHVVDVSEKRKLLLKTGSLYALCAGILTFFASPFIHDRFSNHHVSIGIYTIIFCTGILRSFTGPNFTALIGTIVPRRLLQNATTWSQGTWLFASVTGHASGGFLIAMVGIMGTMIVVTSLLVTAVCIITQLKPKPIVQMGEGRTWESVQQGLRFVYKSKVLLGAFSLDMFAVLFGGVAAMVPVYARDILRIGAEGFGWLNAASDIGAIIVVILLTVSPIKRNQGRKLIFAVGAFGLCVIMFGLSQWFLLSFFALMMAGMLDGVSVVTRGTIMQLNTPDHLRGRVGSVSSMFVNSSNELGQFESGVMAKLLGVVPSVVFGGCVTIGVAVITWFRAPTLRKLQY